MLRFYGVTALPVDDVSPLWSYRGSWSTLSVPSAGTTSHVSLEQWANASITFTGIGIELNGKLGDNWSDFAVVVDGEVHELSPTNPRPDSISPLYRNTTLGPGEHRLTLVDRRTSMISGTLQLDGGVIMMGQVDYGAYPTGSGYIEDNSPNITYRGYWNNTIDSYAADYVNSMTHRTQFMGSTATIQFYGNSIAVNGVIGPNYGAYTVSVDGGPAQSFTGYSPTHHARQVMYMANQLSVGDHTLTIRKTGNDSKIVAIDSAISFTFVPPETVEQTAPLSVNESRGINKPALIGGIVGGVVALLLLLMLALVLLRRRKQKRAALREAAVAEDEKYAADDARSEMTLVSAVLTEKKFQEEKESVV